VVPGQSHGESQGAKPQEADKFLQVKGIYKTFKLMNIQKRYMPNLQTGVCAPDAVSAKLNALYA
jgi:hypothetical protein